MKRAAHSKTRERNEWFAVGGVILSLPFSREETRLSWLNRSVALYRLAFGQPQQDDLLALLDQVRDEIAPEALAQLQISLRPD